MPVLLCPKCKNPFCSEPTEEKLKETIKNLKVLMRGKRVTLRQKLKRRIGFDMPPKSLGCIYCGHKFKLNDALVISND